MSELLAAARLAEAGRLEEALTIYQRLNQNDADNLRTQGTLLLMLRRYNEAAEVFEHLDKVLLRSLPPGDRSLKEVAVARWLASDRASAVEVAAKNLLELRVGRTTYTDYPGGVEDAIILLYFAHEMGHAERKNEALKFLRKLASRARIRGWPGPLAQYLLGSATANAVLLEATGVSEIREALEKINEKASALHRMVKTLFVFGLDALLKDQRETYLEYMNKCAKLPNPKLVLFWYLAREIDRSAK